MISDEVITVPFCLLKKVIYINDSKFTYWVDKNNYGHTVIDGYSLIFYMNKFGEIIPETIRFG